MIRRLKLAYEFYNFFNKNILSYNEEFYKRYGINKKYYSSVSSEDFSEIDSEIILKEGRKHNLEDIPFYQKLDESAKQSIRSFDDLGYSIIKNFFNLETVDTINREIDTLLDNKEIKFKYGNKLMFAIHKSIFLRDLWDSEEFKMLLDYLICGKATLFQSINFLKGSEQKTHSDSIHMTTFPLGGLLGVWLALEDVSLENGTIHYYPESHKLPYYLNRDYDNIGNKFFIGDKDYAEYEKMIEQKIEKKGIKKETFNAKAGDLFIWHANLFHGGEPHKDPTKTRKSMVLHYFDSRRVCYHEITQRPALIRGILDK